MRTLNDLIRPHLRNLVPYSSARDEFDQPAEVWLDANENPFNNDVNRYPDPYQNALKSALGEKKGIDTSNIFIGNGSDEAIDLLFRTFCEPGKDEVIIMPPTYGMYKVSANINGVGCISAPLNEDFSLNVENVLGSITANTKMVFVCSPNNPTGNLLNREAIEKILTNFDGLVVLDEAYIDFSESDTWIKDLNKHPQLIVLQTLSKSYAGAGLRVGMLFAQPEIITILNKIKPPYNVNILSQNKALELVNDTKTFTENLSLIKEEKGKLKIELEKLDCVKEVFLSSANFWLMRVGEANGLYNYLAQNGIVVRNRSNQLNCSEMLRITVGTPKENVRLIEILKKYTS